jgi:B3 DNA binding domain
MQTIPATFAQLLKDQTGTAFRRASISSPLGRIWHVEVSRIGEDTYFTKGWPEFLVAHEVQIWDMMVFSHEGQSSLSVEIFDKTTCLKEYNCSLSGKKLCLERFTGCGTWRIP